MHAAEIVERDVQGDRCQVAFQPLAKAVAQKWRRRLRVSSPAAVGRTAWVSNLERMSSRRPENGSADCLSVHRAPRCPIVSSRSRPGTFRSCCGQTESSTCRLTRKLLGDEAMPPKPGHLVFQNRPLGMETASTPRRIGTYRNPRTFPERRRAPSYGFDDRSGSISTDPFSINFGQCPLCSAGSTDRCNTGIESLCWGFKSQGLAWPFVDLPRYLVEMSL
jgi:hypothetical protein